MAFRGLSRTASFGQATAGFATGNEAYVHSDGAVLRVTSSRDVDRTGRAYGHTPSHPVRGRPLLSAGGRAAGDGLAAHPARVRPPVSQRRARTAAASVSSSPVVVSQSRQASVIDWP